MKNRLLICTQTGDLFDECSADYEYLNKNYKMLKEYGFEAIDLNLDHLLTYNDMISGKPCLWDKSLDEIYEHFEITKKALFENGIIVSQIHASFPLYIEGNEEINEYLIKVMEKTLAVSKYLDCPVVVAHPCPIEDKEKEREINLGMYENMIPAAKKYGVKVCLENLFMAFNDKPIEGICSTAEEACWYINTLNEKAGEEIFGFCLDIGHANLTSRNIKNFILTLGHHLTCLHIHDNDGIYDFHLMPYTQARIWGQKCCTDWEGMIEGLKKIDYQGNLSFEAYQAFNRFPVEVRPEALRLLSAIGRYFRNRILS